MASQEINYSSLSDSLSNTAAAIESPNEVEETPRDSGLMIHIVPETSRARWSHIEDLDSFFTRMYNYHQNHGFTVIVLDEAFQLFEFGFVVWLLTFTVHCIKHSVLFGNTSPKNIYTKVTINDVIIPMGECVGNFGGITFFILFVSTLYFMMRLIKMVYHVTQYSDIKTFYNSVLLIEDNDLDNITWHEIKKKIREVQAEQQMCIDKEQLTELDIYHRILRFKNYMVALMNKNLLPVRFNMPIFGEVVSLSRGLSYNIDFILFRGPGSPFQNNWQLRDDYAVRNNQMQLAQRLSNLILWVAIVNLIMAPAIFLWQIINFLFAYANILRKDPAALGMRTWSNYGRLYLRHFNELEHELDARLNRAYQHAEKYLSSFSSPVMTVVAKNVLFLTGGLLVLLLALGIYEEFVFQIEHVLTIITALSAIGLVCRTFIPDENLVWCPEQLMTAVLANTHYLPIEWKNQAHTALVRKEFGHFFQFKANYILNEICSPILTPFILIFVFRPKSLEIVKFFKSFTVTVKGVGNVCSFAQMDIRKYGNPEWQLKSSEEFCPSINRDEKSICYPVENGKTELSLVHFTLTNPEWSLPHDAVKFLRSIRQKAVLDLKKAKTSNRIGQNAMTESLISFGAIGEEYSSIANYVLNDQNVNSSKLSTSVNPVNKLQKDVIYKPLAGSSNQESDFEQMLQQNLEDPLQANQEKTLEDNESHIRPKHTKSATGSLDKSTRKMRVYKCEGRLEGPSEAILYSISNIASSLAANHVDVTEADMCLSSLYLHELHLRHKHTKNTTISQDSRGYRQTIVTSKVAENTPLLGNILS